MYRSAVEQVPVSDYELPLGSAEVLQEGKDITIISYGPPLYTIETALHHLRHPGQDLEKLIPQDLRGLSVELIDLRTIVPYDVSRREKKILSGVEAHQLSPDRDGCQEREQDWPMHDRTRGTVCWQCRFGIGRRDPAAMLPAT